MFNSVNMSANQSYEKQRKHITANGRYFISTNDTWDHGWETMVFSRDPVTEEIDFSELDVDRYNDMEEAYDGHDAMILKWENKM